uniref:Uncharacterized protein n=1 Tax=Chlamydomonas euryale TaxID=1486919 RepID=A0A7R9V770_9CHLO
MLGKHVCVAANKAGLVGVQLVECAGVLQAHNSGIGPLSWKHTIEGSGNSHGSTQVRDLAPLMEAHNLGIGQLPWKHTIKGSGSSHGSTQAIDQATLMEAYK